jgi:hypothetical protein
MAELPPALFVFLLLIMFPVLDLIAVGTGMATAILLTNEAADRAASQPDYGSALAAMVQQSNQGLNTGFAQFAKLKPAEGYLSSGTDLYVEATNFRSGGKTTTFGPNQPLPPPVDTSSNVYEYNVKSAYYAGPLISLHFVPIIGDVPGLGQPARLTFASARAVEHPDGLDGVAGNGSSGSVAGGSSGGTSGGTVAKFDRTIISDKVGISAGLDQSGWNYPDMYKRISQAGETVVSEAVFIVPANTTTWVPANLGAQPGQHLWLDSKAVGQWDAGGSPPMTMTDASGGMGGLPLPFSTIGPGLLSVANMQALVAYAGNNPPAYAATSYDLTGTFLVGDNLLNYPLTQSGPLVFGINDGAPSDNLGAQMVKVIITN